MLTRYSVRTISASFGFSIGSSAPPSSNHTPIVEEHPSKRRKTVQQADADSVVEKATTQTVLSTNSTYRSKAAKKSWQVEEGPLLAKPDVDAEDSFVAFVRGKKTRTKIPAAPQDIAAAHDEPGPAASSSFAGPRCRRRAAAATAADSTVAAQHVDATVSTSGLKRPVQLEEKKATKVSRKQTRVHGLISGKETSVTASKCIAKAPATRRRRERKVRPEADIPFVHKDDQTCEIGNSVRDEKRLYTQKGAKACAVAKATSRRQPLQDGDVNAAVRSVSPEKMRERVRKAATVKVKEGNVDKDLTKYKLPDRRLSRRRSVESAEAYSVDDRSIIAPLGATTSINLRDRLASNTMTKPCSQTVRSTKRPAIRSTKQLKCTQVVTEPQKYVGSTEKMHDEDIDWLFETQPPKALKPPRRSGAKVQTAMHPRRETPDVDLDGLLSEIASLANGYDQRTDERHKLDNGAKKRVRRRIALGQ